MIKDIYIALTLLKAIIIIVGMCVFVIPNFTHGWKNNDNKKLKKAGLFFLGIFGLIALLTIIEFSIALNR
jgi:hypothetical protein